MRRSERIKRKQRSKPIVPIKKTAAKPDAAPLPGKHTGKGGFYDTQYKKLLIIPFTLLFLAIISIGIHTAATGDFINRGVSLKGGLQITIPFGNIDTDNLEGALQTQYPQHDINIRTLEEAGTPVAVTVSADITPEEEGQIDTFIDSVAGLVQTDRDSLSVETIGSSLGATFFQQTSKALFIAFLFMGFVVYLYFGQHTKIKVATGVATVVASTFMYSGSSILNIIAVLLGISLIVTYTRYSIPSVAVILAALSDIITTLAVVNTLGIKLSTAGIAAFLMLIGYSVDTDILLSTRVLKHSGGSVYDRVIGALKTGLTMNVTTLAAVIIALVFAQSDIIKQIMTILLIGLAADMINTWLQNVGILRWYLKKHEDDH